ncbi:MAG: SIR2 family protein [Acidobacteria bacterium]|nr:SIR2 family protein [Acidobacteriota bacterium]
MPPSQPSFDHEATLDELAGVGKNRRFDEVIDDVESEEIQVICKRGDEEMSLAKPSRAFYFGDRNLYDQEAKRFDQEEKARILNTDQFSRNLVRFDELKRSCQRGFVIPFVGAGMSKSAGCPEWKEYLLQLCGEACLDAAAMRVRLEESGDYEGVMNDVVAALGENRFNLDFERDFKTPEEIGGAVSLLPTLFDNSAVTTNFDRVLEDAYRFGGKAFVEKVTGRGQPAAFFRAIPAGERYLLKLHGNLDSPAERVLNRAEYDLAYGNDGNIHFDQPLPKLLRRLFTSYSFLFLGCSLSADRTVQTFMKVGQQEGQESLPHHYALQCCPADSEKRQVLEQRLADAHISPIWYPDGAHEHVEQILRLLLD